MKHVLSLENKNKFTKMYMNNSEIMFKEIWEKWLMKRKEILFNYIYKLLQYEIWMNKNENERNRMKWLNNKKIMYFNNKSLKVKKFREFIHFLINSAKKLMKEKLLFENMNELSEIKLWKLKNDVNLCNAMHSFILKWNNELMRKRKKIMNKFKKSWKWSKLMNIKENELKFNATKMKNYECKMKKFLKYILILIHIIKNQSMKRTEIITLKYTNVLQILRNIFIEKEQIMIVIKYHKSQIIMNLSKVISRFLSLQMRKLIMMYLTKILLFQ